MDKTISPSSIAGSLLAPASKSQTIRALAAAMLARGASQISHPSACDDALAMLDIARKLGAKIEERENAYHILGGINLKASLIDCGESGLAARLMIALAALSDQVVNITGKGTLLNRKLENIAEPLKMLGADCQSTDGKLPFRVKGPLRGGQIMVDGSAGSQFVSGLLMALPLVANDSTLEVSDLKSKPYIDMTLEVLRQFGITINHQNYQNFTIPGNQKYIPAAMQIEGDWSGAAFLLVAGAIAGDVSVTNLNLNSKQADIKILEALRSVGAKLCIKENSILIKKSPLKCFEFDATHCPDLFPALAILAANAKGTSRIDGVDRLKQKESDRGLVLHQELGKLGVNIRLDGNVMLIEGEPIKGGTVFSHHDHRIAMAAAIAGLVANDCVTIQNAECVSKSYPQFFEDLALLQKSLKFQTKPALA